MNGSRAPGEEVRSPFESGGEVPESAYHESEASFAGTSATEQSHKPRKSQSGEASGVITRRSSSLSVVLNDFASSSDVGVDPRTGKKLFWGSAYPPRFDEPHVWNLTYRQQAEKLEHFRLNLEQRGILAPGTVGKPDKPDVHMLLRFLKARKFDIDLATTMFVNSLEWRKAYGADELLDGYEFPEVDRFIKYWPQGYHKTDKLGRPVYIQQLGGINTRELKKFTNEQRILKFHVQEYERLVRRIMPICSRIQAKNVDQTFAILDVKGVGLASFNQDVRSLLGQITAVDQNNYPEMMGHMCIINAPLAFRSIWKFVKPMLDQRTQEKIEVCPADYIPALTKWIDIENIPDFLGGRSQGSLLDDVGAWNDPEILNEADDEFEMDAVDVTPAMRRSSTEERSSNKAPLIGGARATPNGLQNHQLESLKELEMETVMSPPRSVSECESFFSFAMEDDAASITSQANSNYEANGHGQHSGTVNNANIIDRTSVLESQVSKAVARLKPYMPNSYQPKASEAPVGSLLHRIEVMEDSMVMLLLAQEQEFVQKGVAITKKKRSCCCCIM